MVLLPPEPPRPAQTFGLICFIITGGGAWPPPWANAAAAERSTLAAIADTWSFFIRVVLLRAREGADRTRLSHKGGKGGKGGRGGAGGGACRTAGDRRGGGRAGRGRCVA